MTNTEHMELARLCAEWEAAEKLAGTSSNPLPPNTRTVYRKCRRDLEAILNAATITPDTKEDPCHP